MINKSTERGQALILIALAAIGLFAFAALAIDSSRAFSNKRHAQNAADTAALAGALAHIREPNAANKVAAAKDAAEKIAAANGFKNDADNSVEVKFCDEGITCEGIGADPSEYLRVRIVSKIPSTFGRVIGWTVLESAAEAIARVQGSSGSSSGSSYAEGAMISTSTNPPGGTCFTLNGGAYVHTHDSGIYVNCPDDDKALKFNSNMQLYMDETGQVVGCYNDDNLPQPLDPNDKGKGWFDPIDCDANAGVSKDFSHEFDSAPTMPTPPTSLCTQKGKYEGGVFTPGYFEDDNINLQAGTSFMPDGVYCFRNGKAINANGAALSGGTVTIIFEGNGGINAGSALNFDGLEVYTDTGSLNVDGANMEADTFRFYTANKGMFKVGSGGKVTSGNAYIYLGVDGDLEWNSQSIINLTAPKKPSTYGGLLVHKPYINKKATLFNGGTNHILRGTFLVPGSDVTFNGNTNFELHSQIIGEDFIVNGGGQVHIWYDPDDNYLEVGAPPASIELTR